MSSLFALWQTEVRRLAALFVALSSILAAPATAEVFSSPAAPMDFALRQGEGCPQAGCIAANGTIGSDTVRRFQRFVRANAVQAGAVVELNSTGGDVVGAMQLGLILRRQGFDTRVGVPEGVRRDGAAIGPGICASACAYVFVAGVRRELDGGARLGVHQFSPQGQAKDMWETQRLVGLISEYLDAVGADPKLERLALLTPPDKVHWLTETEIAKLGVVTGKAAVSMSMPAADRR